MPPINRAYRINAPVQVYEGVILLQEQLCDALESLADSLPGQVNTYAAAQLAEQLLPTLWQCQNLEEGTVFPLLLETDCASIQTIDRLRAEHLEDEDHAGILSDAVMAFARNPRRSDADRLGYSLRGLFQPLRRHAAFDRSVILPMYRSALRG